MRILPILLVSLLFAADANAQTKSAKRSAFASHRDRAPNGRFEPIRARDARIRGPVLGRGLFNGGRVGQSTGTVKFKPATARRPGTVEVEVPELYVGDQWRGGSTPRQVFGTDIRGKQIAISGTLTTQTGASWSSFARATFVGTIPAGADVSRAGLTQALRSIHLNEGTLKWSAE